MNLIHIFRPELEGALRSQPEGAGSTPVKLWEQKPVAMPCALQRQPGLGLKKRLI